MHPGESLLFDKWCGVRGFFICACISVSLLNSTELLSFLYTLEVDYVSFLFVLAFEFRLGVSTELSFLS